jgi:predicted transcriptional regulator
MHARDIMTHEVISIGPDATVQDVVRLLSDYNISGCPVQDGRDHMVGIITEADIIGKEGEHVGDIMTPRVVSVLEDTDVDEIARILTGSHFKRVPVLRGERVMGIVSRADIVRMIARRWVCPVCGAIQHACAPEQCYACGADAGRLERELEPRTEIHARE